MIFGKKVLAIIPARSGSKEIKNKNIVKINNIPLINYSLIFTKKIKFVDKIIVSTDSNLIAREAVKYGAEVPFLRKKEFSGDFVTTEATLRNSLIETFINKNVVPKMTSSNLCIECTFLEKGGEVCTLVRSIVFSNTIPMFTNTGISESRVLPVPSNRIGHPRNDFGMKKSRWIFFGNWESATRQ